MSSFDSLKSLLKDCCRRFQNKANYTKAKLYNKKGLEISQDDMQFMKSGDIYYVALEGESFNNFAILDDYDLGTVIG